MSLPALFHYDFHELANLFPLMEGDAFQGLRADIEAHGVRDQIVMLDGKILDGRNRYRAAQAARIKIPRKMFRVFDHKLDGDPLAWVISKNLKRRNLNETQRAWVASKLANLPDGVRSDRSANLPTLAVSQADAAKMLNVSERGIRYASAIRSNQNATPELLAAVEQGKITVNLAKQAADLPAVEQREIAAQAIDGDTRIVKKVVKKRARAKRERDLGAKQLALPDKRYGVIVADPEWKFKPWTEAGMGRAADNHYPTSATELIAARDVPSIAAKECVLFLWAIAPMLPEAIAVMAAWGFTYRTHAVWHKLRPGKGRGKGYWFTSEHELLLVGTTRAKTVAPATAICGSVIAAPVGLHSAKPEIFLELIEREFPSLPKIELNRRGPPRPGWDAWGLEAVAPSDCAAAGRL